jgi:hypothetical protein
VLPDPSIFNKDISTKKFALDSSGNLAIYQYVLQRLPEKRFNEQLLKLYTKTAFTKAKINVADLYLANKFKTARPTHKITNH